MSRPPKLPYPGSGRVVKSCSLLGDFLKLLWLEHVVLDKDQGAYIGAGPMGLRLGRSREMVERGRRELIRLGLLIRGECQRGKTGTYYPTLPTSCVPSLRPTVAEVARLAERLDAHIRRVRGDSPGSEAASDPPPHSTPPSAVPDAKVASSDYPERRQGRRHFSSEDRAQSGVTSHATRPALRVVGGGKGGEVPQPLNTEGGDPQPSPPPFKGGVPALSRGERVEQPATPISVVVDVVMREVGFGAPPDSEDIPLPEPPEGDDEPYWDDEGRSGETAA